MDHVVGNARWCVGGCTGEGFASNEDGTCSSVHDDFHFETAKANVWRVREGHGCMLITARHVAL